MTCVLYKNPSSSYFLSLLWPLHLTPYFGCLSQNESIWPAKQIQYDSRIIHKSNAAILKWKCYLLISQLGPVHPFAHAQVNSLTGGVDDNIGDIFSLLFSKTLLDSLIGRALTGFPIELIPRIPRRTTTGVVCSSVLLPTFRPLLSYFVGFWNKIERKMNNHENKWTLKRSILFGKEWKEASLQMSDCDENDNHTVAWV